MSNLPVIDAIGFSAAGLVLATFCMRSMRALRWVAIASNLAFIAYGYLGSLAPVLLLHLLLLPVNVYRLTQLRGAQASSARTEERSKRAPAALNCGLFRQSLR
jgi:fatty acid desaturase